MSETGIAQAASHLLDEMRHAQGEVRQREQHAAEEASRAFHVAMEESKKTQANERVRFRKEQIAKTSGGATLRNALAGTFSPRVTLVGEAARRDNSRLAKLLGHLIAGQDKMAEIIRDSLSGKQFSSSDILQMQAQVFRYCQELEYSTKVVEKADTGTKQILNTQIG